MSGTDQNRIVRGASAAAPASLGDADDSPVEPGGLAGWVLGLIRQRNGNAARRHLKVVETLALGGRRHLLLVTCDGERFLVGSGADRIDAIVRVGAERAAEDVCG